MKSFHLALCVTLFCFAACSKNAANNNSNSNLTGNAGTPAVTGSQAGSNAPAQGASGSSGHAATGVSGATTPPATSGSGAMPGVAVTLAGSSGSSAVAGQTGASGAGGAVANAGAGGAAGTSAVGGAPTEAMGCDTTKLYEVPADTSATGPWPVGVKTIQVAITGGMIPVEIWYPATIGADAGQTKVTYDLSMLVHTIPPYTTGITAAENQLQDCNCYRDIPIDTSHGPYPLVVFIHGTASFRTLSLSTMTQWASRGFVVAAADHPGLGLQDVLADGVECQSTGIQQDVRRDVTAVIAGFTGKTGDFAFFGSAVDLTRLGVSGHSQGAEEGANLGNLPNVQVDMPMADYLGAPVVGAVKSSFVIGGLDDAVVAYSSDQMAYGGSVGMTKRLVGMTGGNHMNVTDFCWMRNSMGQTTLDVAASHNICGGTGIAFIATLAQCGSMDAKKGTEIVNYTSTAVLEETLHCADRSAAWSMLNTKYPEVGDYQHMP